MQRTNESRCMTFLPFFFQFLLRRMYDTRGKPIPTCVSAERPSKYEVVTAGEYSDARLAETYRNATKVKV